MTKKELNPFKQTIQAVKKDAKRISLAFDGLEAFALLSSETNVEGLALAQRELLSAIDAMRGNLDAIVGLIGIEIDLISPDRSEHGENASGADDGVPF